MTEQPLNASPEIPPPPARGRRRRGGSRGAGALRRRTAPPAANGALGLLLLAAGCAGDGGAASGAAGGGAAGAAPAIEISVERPVSPDGSGGLAAVAGVAPGAAPAAGSTAAPPAPEAFAELVPRLAVRDLGASLAFYRSLLGFEPVGGIDGGSGASGEPAERALLVRGAVRIALEETAAELGEAPSLATVGEEPAISIVLSVADAAAMFDRLADRAPLVSGLRDTAWGNREFALADPDGHVVVLSQPL